MSCSKRKHQPSPPLLQSPPVDGDPQIIDGRGEAEEEDGEEEAAPTIASSFTKPSAKISRLVRLRERNQCWLCGFHGLHVAHIIARSDSLLFQMYQEQGLLHFTSLNDLNNLILLCAGCHTCFDQRVPIWAFLPSDLDSFIAHETAFQRARAQAAANGMAFPRPRRLVSETLTYTRYLIRPGFIPETPFVSVPQKSWTGDPIAAMLRSQSIISGIQRLPLSRGGLPAEIAEKFAQLLILYSHAPPQLHQAELQQRCLDYRPAIDEDFQNDGGGGGTPGGKSGNSEAIGEATHVETRQQNQAQSKQTRTYPPPQNTIYTNHLLPPGRPGTPKHNYTTLQTVPFALSSSSSTAKTFHSPVSNSTSYTSVRSANPKPSHYLPNLNTLQPTSTPHQNQKQVQDWFVGPDKTAAEIMRWFTGMRDTD